MYHYYPSEDEIIKALQDEPELLDFWLTVKPNISDIIIADKNDGLPAESIKQIVKIIKEIEDKERKMKRGNKNV